MKAGDKVQLKFGVIVHEDNGKIGVITTISPYPNYVVVEVSGRTLMVHKAYLISVKAVEKVLFS